jgi:adenosylcobinamide kinase / adenosylcobinamide-phosphate guanylyltransferase
VITLVLGGTRSGKSEVAERIAAASARPVIYVATARAYEGDAEFAERVVRHRKRRPTDWSTVEAGAALPAALRAIDVNATVLVDALGTWVAAHDDLCVDVDDLLTALGERPGMTVVVSDEVGLGVHPSTDVGRRFRDVLGDVNRAVASISDEVMLVVAGRVLPLSAR